MVQLEPDPFLNELTKLFERNKTAGSVWVTLKRSSLKPGAKRRKVESESTVVVGQESGADEECKCLVRATDGKRKFSTVVSAKDHLRFQAAYATVLKAHMDALKKKEKKDKKEKKKPATKL